MESRSLPRFLGAIIAGTFTLTMVMGSVFLTQVDATLMVQRPTRVAQQLPTTTLYPTLTPFTPGALETPVYSPTPGPTPTPCIYPSDWLPYEVQVGETLAQFVEVANSSIAALMAANCLDSAEIYPGDVIYLPPIAFTTPTPVIAYRCGPPPTWRFVYYVRRGDTLYSLATRYGTTVEAIIRANCLVSNQIYPGQALYLPPVLPAPPVFTRTPLPSPTFWPTLTPTPEITDTPTSTPEITDTPTPTPEITDTPTPTPEITDTPTPEITDTPTPTPSITPSVEPTEPVTPTDTPSPTETPTEMPPDTPIPTPTHTPMAEIPTPTEPPAPSPTPTPTG